MLPTHPSTNPYLSMLTERNKAVGKELELIELRADCHEFMFNLEMKALDTSEPEKTILNKIINSEDYQKMKLNI